MSAVFAAVALGSALLARPSVSSRAYYQMLRAETAEAAGDWPEAQAALRVGLVYDPDSPRLNVRALRAMWRTGAEGLDVQLRLATRVARGDPELWRVAGLIAWAEGDLPAARLRLLRAHRLAPSSPVGRASALDAARILDAEGRGAEALRLVAASVPGSDLEVDLALAVDPARVPAIARRHRAEEWNARAERALRADGLERLAGEVGVGADTTALASVDPLSGGNRVAAARVFLAGGKPALAMRILEDQPGEDAAIAKAEARAALGLDPRVELLDPSSPRTRAATAALLVAAGRWPEAEAVLAGEPEALARLRSARARGPSLEDERRGDALGGPEADEAYARAARILTRERVEGVDGAPEALARVLKKRSR